CTSKITNASGIDNRERQAESGKYAGQCQFVVPVPSITTSSGSIPLSLVAVAVMLSSAKSVLQQSPPGLTATSIEFDVAFTPTNLESTRITSSNGVCRRCEKIQFSRLRRSTQYLEG